jgi:HEAT repeat protein
MLSDEEPTEDNPYGDDFFRHRLGLAGLCLGELGEEQKGKLGDKLSVVTAKVFGGWYKQGFLQTLQHMEKALKSLARCNAFVRECDWRRWVGEHPAVGVDAPSFLDWVAKMVEDPIERFVAILAVGLMGGSAARPDVLSLFTELLEDEDANTRRAATLASMGLGFSLVTREIFLQIVELLKDEDGDVRRAAAEAVGSIGSSAAVPEFLDPIAKLLEDKRAYVREAAAEAVGYIGSSAAVPEILSRIAELLEDEDVDVRRAAAEAVGKMGRLAIREMSSLSDRLTRLFGDNNSRVRVAAAVAKLRTLVPVAPPDEVHKFLISNSGDLFLLQLWASWFLDFYPATFGSLLSRTAELLRDKNRDACIAAAKVVRSMGSAAAVPEILSGIAKLLEDKDRHVRWVAADAVGGMGSSAATQEILSGIAKLLEGGDEDVRKEAARAVGSMGSSAAVPEILSRIAKLLEDEDEYVRDAAVGAVEAMGIRLFRKGRKFAAERLATLSDPTR